MVNSPLVTKINSDYFECECNGVSTPGAKVPSIRSYKDEVCASSARMERCVPKSHSDCFIKIGLDILEDSLFQNCILTIITNWYLNSPFLLKKIYGGGIFLITSSGTYLEG